MGNFRDSTSEEILDVFEQQASIQFRGNAIDFGLEKIDESIDTSKDLNITPNIPSERQYIYNLSLLLQLTTARFGKNLL